MRGSPHTWTLLLDAIVNTTMRIHGSKPYLKFVKETLMHFKWVLVPVHIVEFENGNKIQRGYPTIIWMWWVTLLCLYAKWYFVNEP